MPKVSNTRAHRAKRLSELVARGPSLHCHLDGRDLDMEARKAIITDMERQCRLWLDTWVVPLVAGRDGLVPELRGQDVD